MARDIKTSTYSFCIIMIFQLYSYLRAADVTGCDEQSERRRQGDAAVTALYMSRCELLCQIQHYSLFYIHRSFDY